MQKGKLPSLDTHEEQTAEDQWPYKISVPPNFKGALWGDPIAEQGGAGGGWGTVPLAEEHRIPPFDRGSPAAFHMRDLELPETGLEPLPSHDELSDSPFSDTSMSPNLYDGSAFAPDAKQKQIVFKPGEEMSVLCHGPASEPDEELRRAREEIDSLKFKLAMVGDKSVLDYGHPGSSKSHSPHFGNDEHQVAWAGEMHLLKEYELFE